MYVVMGVHHPKPGMENALLEVQERFGKAQQGHRGLISALIWKAEKSEEEAEEKESKLALRVCVKCGRQVDPSAGYCPNCGNQLSKS